MPNMARNYVRDMDARVIAALPGGSRQSSVVDLIIGRSGMQQNTVPRYVCPLYVSREHLTRFIFNMISISISQTPCPSSLKSPGPGGFGAWHMCVCVCVLSSDTYYTHAHFKRASGDSFRTSPAHMSVY